MKTSQKRLAAPWQRGANAWSRLAERDRRLLGFALAGLLLVVLWWLTLSPAIDVLRNGQARRLALDAELTTMRKLAQEASSLQALPVGSAEGSLRALDQSVRETLDEAAQLSIAGDRATVVLKGVAAGNLAEWLAAARTEAKTLPAEVHLSRNAAGNGWDGTVVLVLPPK